MRERSASGVQERGIDERHQVDGAWIQGTVEQQAVIPRFCMQCQEASAAEESVQVQEKGGLFLSLLSPRPLSAARSLFYSFSAILFVPFARMHSSAVILPYCSFSEQRDGNDELWYKAEQCCMCH